MPAGAAMRSCTLSGLSNTRPGLDGVQGRLPYGPAGVCAVFLSAGVYTLPEPIPVIRVPLERPDWTRGC